MTPHRTLFRRPTGTYYSISDGTVWLWYERTVITPTCFRTYWKRRRAPGNRFPSDATYAGNPPTDLLLAVRNAGGAAHHYDLHRGQEHVRA